MATSFSKRLQREVLGNPKKASLLGLLCLVAAYFWAPLVAPWFKGDDVSAATPTDAIPTPAATASAAPSTAAAPVATTFTWRQVAEALDRARQTAPALVTAKRDPFKPAPDPAPSAADVAEAKTSLQEITPQLAGLSLSSTMIGPRFSIALIDGETYRVGEDVFSATDDAIVFRLKSVHAKHVVLERNGQEFELGLKTAELALNEVRAAPPTTTPDGSSQDE